MKDYESIKSKLKKLLALAEGGIDGEARNARKLLDRLCTQHGISVDEFLDTEKKKWYRFEVGKRMIFKDLFVQCYCCVKNTDKMSFFRASSTEFEVELTAYEYAELLSMFKWHKNNLKKDMENMMQTLLISYCSKHHITNHTKEEGEEPRKPITREEFNRLKAALAMQDSLGNNYYRKQIEK
ncbi:MAG: DUF2786 domain-containing protein [Lachnospiraceae bacterium]|nr:DUF2786 domain-containing protein [Lachnospiraceae bacterium]